MCIPPLLLFLLFLRLLLLTFVGVVTFVDDVVAFVIIGKTVAWSNDEGDEMLLFTAFVSSIDDSCDFNFTLSTKTTPSDERGYDEEYENDDDEEIRISCIIVASH
jgi:hypothetical protein